MDTSTKEVLKRVKEMVPTLSINVSYGHEDPPMMLDLSDDRRIWYLVYVEVMVEPDGHKFSNRASFSLLYDDDPSLSEDQGFAPGLLFEAISGLRHNILQFPESSPGLAALEEELHAAHDYLWDVRRQKEIEETLGRPTKQDWSTREDNSRRWSQT